jgi:2-C-methyl-D-erythritol 2,4-cyclodiphosphate synthase
MKQNYRIGTGYDIHATDENRDLIIGGVKIPHTKGLLGHSDADVLIHAIIDAMLGALALSDIGTLFPDNKEEFKNISSLILLKKVYELILEKGYEINNIDSNIIAQEPKMMPHIPKMREVLAGCLDIDVDMLSIKAKTNEKMDAVGRLEAIEANAVVMLNKKEF